MTTAILTHEQQQERDYLARRVAELEFENERLRQTADLWKWSYERLKQALQDGQTSV